ncbi:interleukin-12 receptor subunit beta-1 isoform X2 [Motacilla alba alba]|uniref:interleukin-12 receptor subunit beta-1 isoform X2 n=1 Tax=Motacilla alba alba TaxID=1094192 RepID=UPI0018D56F94|nr:interleukin-12 receptor subunit beta-1 isoform X2 [Motacilla alba alba]
MEILTQNHRDGVKMVNPRWQRAGAGASGTGISGKGEHGGLGVTIAGAAALIPHLSNMASRQQPHHRSPHARDGVGMQELPATALSRRHPGSPRRLLLEEMRHLQAFLLLLAAPRPRRQHLLHPEPLVSWAARRGGEAHGMSPGCHPVPAPSPALRSAACAAGLRPARRPATASWVAKCTSSTTPRPGWRHAGGTKSAGPPTTPFTSTRLVSAPGTGLAASTGTENCQTTQNCLILPVKLDPPTGMSFSKAGSQLRVRVPQPQCKGLEQPPQHEARVWRLGDSGWTQVTCETVMVTAAENSVTCALGDNGTFVVQLRHKPPHWSSSWSDWSSNTSEEILRRPVLSHQLGKLGRDGQRVLRLSWQPVLKEQKNVTYKVNMLACGCAEPEEHTVVLGGEVTEHNIPLSGAEYEILLTAVNAAGRGPGQRLRVPAEQRADLSFKEISVAGSTVTARWEAPVPGDAFCFEQQTLPEPPKQGVCIQREFPANSTHVERGALGAPGCHRLAVHGRDEERGWATFALGHRYAGNDSLDVPFNISIGDGAAVLRWEPSPRAACPGALAKYLICHVAEGDNVTYSEVDATASNYTLRNLQPGTGYRVGVWEVTEDSERTCRAWWPFQTKALGPQGAPWRGNLSYLGIWLGLPAAAAIYHLSKRRARRLLFPPLPKPVGTKAIQFSAGEMSQGQPRTGLLEPSERFSPAELLLTEPNPSEETTDTGGQTAVPHPDVSQPGPALEKPAALVMSPAGCGEELPFAYRRQEMLIPVGSPPSGSTGCTGHPPGEEEEEEEEEEEGRQGLHQPLVPIALLISDKPIIIRDEGGWDPPPEKSVPQPSAGWSGGGGHGASPGMPSVCVGR